MFKSLFVVWVALGLLGPVCHAGPGLERFLTNPLSASAQKLQSLPVKLRSEVLALSDTEDDLSETEDEFYILLDAAVSGRMRASSVVKFVGLAMNDSNPELRIKAATLFSELCYSLEFEQSQRNELEGLALQSDPKAGVYIFRGLMNESSTHGYQGLINSYRKSLIESPYEEFRHEAIFDVFSRGERNSEAIEILLRGIEDSAYEVKFLAFSRLKEFKPNTYNCMQTYERLFNSKKLLDQLYGAILLSMTSENIDVIDNTLWVGIEASLEESPFFQKLTVLLLREALKARVLRGGAFGEPVATAVQILQNISTEVRDEMDEIQERVRIQAIRGLLEFFELLSSDDQSQKLFQESDEVIARKKIIRELEFFIKEASKHTTPKEVRSEFKKASDYIQQRISSQKKCESLLLEVKKKSLN